MDALIRKTAFLFFLLLVTAYGAYAQQPGLFISGTVLNADGLQPLAGTTIKNINSQQALQANEEGYFNIQVNPGDTLLIQHMTYRDARYFVPDSLQASQYALVQLLQQESAPAIGDIRAFPSQRQFEQSLMAVDPGNLTNRNADLDIHLEQVTNDPTKMQKYLDDYMRYQQLYILPDQGAPNNLINPDRWSNFIRDWREGRFTEEGMEKLQGFPEDVREDAPADVNDDR